MSTMTDDQPDVRECGGCEDDENAPHASDCPLFNTLDGKTGEEWRAMAAQAHQDRIDSIERSDSDGFLSQWASDQMAIRYRHCAEVADDGGMVEVEAPVLIETGQVVQGEWVDGNYGPSFMAWKPVERGIRYYHPSQAKSPERRRANDAKKGIEMHVFRAPATVNDRTGRPEADHRSDQPWTDLGNSYDHYKGA